MSSFDLIFLGLEMFSYCFSRRCIGKEGKSPPRDSPLWSPSSEDEDSPRDSEDDTPQDAGLVPTGASVRLYQVGSMTQSQSWVAH